MTVEPENTTDPAIHDTNRSDAGLVSLETNSALKAAAILIVMWLEERARTEKDNRAKDETASQPETTDT